MKPFATSLKLIAGLGLLLAATSCGTTEGGSVSGGMYYGVGFYDPWYYGGYHDDPDIIVTPPTRPERPARPTHPIAPTPTPRPTPSIPAMPRGGGRAR